MSNTSTSVVATRAVVFKTPTLMPIDAITMHGVNVKPNTQNPIGFFGTGLKYAIAVLMRLNIRVRILIGHQEYEFYPSEKDFRGQPIQTIRMRSRRGLFKNWSYTQLPYTTEYGKNCVLWQVLRELESNTRDEDGQSYIYPLVDPTEPEFPREDKTFIIVESDEFADLYEEEYSKIFLPRESLELRFKTGDVEVYNAPSKHIYYRGLRVYDIEKTPSLYTYNFIRTTELTEDRTLKYPFLVKSRLADTLAESPDEEFIRTLAQAKTPSFEAGLDFDYVSAHPGQAFKKVIGQLNNAGHTIGERISGYYYRYSSPAAQLTSPPSLSAPLSEQWEYHLAHNWSLRSDTILRRLVERTIEALKHDPETEKPAESDSPLSASNSASDGGSGESELELEAVSDSGGLESSDEIPF